MLVEIVNYVIPRFLLSMVLVYSLFLNAPCARPAVGGSLGTAYSLCMRLELGMPGYVLLTDNFHAYNV